VDEVGIGPGSKHPYVLLYRRSRDPTVLLALWTMRCIPMHSKFYVIPQLYGFGITRRLVNVPYSSSLSVTTAGLLVEK
jgi:hypothetical protein